MKDLIRALEIFHKHGLNDICAEHDILMILDINNVIPIDSPEGEELVELNWSNDREGTWSYYV